jgi:hypothetical protein
MFVQSVLDLALAQELGDVNAGAKVVTKWQVLFSTRGEL